MLAQPTKCCVSDVMEDFTQSMLPPQVRPLLTAGMPTTSQAMPARERIQWIDVLRGLAIVVMCSTMYGTCFTRAPMRTAGPTLRTRSSCYIWAIGVSMIAVAPRPIH
jgi:hypothetical protein